MERMRATIRPYAWGDRTFIADLQGRTPTGEPEAELWMGAHPSAPSELEGSGRTLDAHIAADPDAALGPASRFGELPFLAKVLAAAQPLSIQAHPSAAQASIGFARENAAGLPLDDPRRVYRDPHHKPELLCALTPFHAKCGFRPVEESRALVASLGHSGLRPLENRLTTGDDAGATLAGVVAWLLGLDPEDAHAIVTALAEACAGVDGGPWREAIGWTGRLHGLYPRDPGVVVALLLNHVTLAPGEALALGAGVVHSYLEGAGIEIMANSDNVVRGGLTAKHVDVAELLAIAEFAPTAAAVQTPTGSTHTFVSPSDEFELSRFVLDGRLQCDVSGPEVLIVTEGSFEIATDDARLTMTPGRPVWVDAVDRRWSVDGCGTLFRTTVPGSRPAGSAR